MPEINAYTRKEISRALNLSAVLGWAIIALPFTAAAGITILPIIALIGLPIAFLLCWFALEPVFIRLMRTPVSYLRAAIWSALIAAGLISISIVIMRFLEWRESLRPARHSQLGGGDYTQSIDGILTAYGWQMLAQNSAIFILIALIIALIIRRIIGPGRSTS